ncbi:MAG: hypothetical protein HY000_36275 [Planctomycetes bacterium]|nr:hypothetical protein [Planctomycetota bacterium]
MSNDADTIQEMETLLHRLDAAEDRVVELLNKLSRMREGFEGLIATRERELEEVAAAR